MRRLFLSLCLSLCLISPLGAQQGPNPPTVGPNTLQKAVTANANGSSLNTQVAGYGFQAVTFVVSGTFSATVNFEATQDTSNWVSLSCYPTAGGAAVTTATATGAWRCNLGGAFVQVRARISSYVSGAVTVTGTSSYQGLASNGQTPLDSIAGAIAAAGTGVLRTDSGTASVVAAQWLDLSTCSDGTLVNCIASIGSTTPTTLGVTQVTTVATSVTVTSNITLLFLGAGQLSINSGVTVAHNGPLIAGLSQIISGSGTFVPGPLIPVLYPEWWGATGGTDDSTALTATWAQAANKTIALQPGRTYIHNANLAWQSNMIVWAYGATLKAKNGAATGVKLGSSSGPFSHIALYGLTYDGNRANRTPPSTDGAAINFANIADISLKDVLIQNSIGDGLAFAYDNAADATTRCFRVNLENVKATNSYRNGLTLDGVKDFVAVRTSWTSSNGMSPQAGVDLEADNATVLNENVTFINPQTDSNTGNGFQFGSNNALNVQVVNLSTRSNGSYGYSGPGTPTVRESVIGFDASNNTSGPYNTAQNAPRVTTNTPSGWEDVASSLTYSATDITTFNLLRQYYNPTSGAGKNVGISLGTEANGEVYVLAVENAGNTAADFVVVARNGARAEILRVTAAGVAQVGTLDILTGGSTTISSGAGSVKMSTANPATNTAWIPIQYAGTTYYVPGWTTNAP